ncbi:MAG: 30S ribosomal protein THX [Deltaproteobacteria bacterium]|nr:30S ribosomal protein THX [Deltaproteobacteria bacterium]
MGRGDKKTKKGKVKAASYGNKRSHAKPKPKFRTKIDFKSLGSQIPKTDQDETTEITQEPLDTQPGETPSEAPQVKTATEKKPAKQKNAKKTDAATLETAAAVNDSGKAEAADTKTIDAEETVAL